jgi:hypothetical protein
MARRCSLEVIVVIVIRQGLGSGRGNLGFVLLLGGVVKVSFRRLERRRFNKHQAIVTRELASQPQKGLFKVVVGLGRNVIVLKVLLAVKRDLLGLDLAVLDLDLVSNEANRNVLANAGQVPVPVGNRLVGNATRHVKHDDSALAHNVVSVAEASKLLLASRVPDIVADGSAVCMKQERMDFDAERRDVLLLKFSSQVTLDKGRLACGRGAREAWKGQGQREKKERNK